MKELKNAKIGDYVLATHYCDHDPFDPWFVGCIDSISESFGRKRYTIDDDTTKRQYRHVFEISKQKGAEWIEEYGSREAKR